jgi:hypothetical protein
VIDEPWASPDAATVSTTPAQSGEPNRRSRGALVAALVGVVALVAAGVFAITKIAGSDDGGAASPTEVGNELMAALEEEDLLGVVDLLLPSEQDALRQPLLDLLEDLKRLEVLSDDASLEGVAGLDLRFEGVNVREEATNVDDISNILLSGTSNATVNGEEIPIGDLLLDNLFDGGREELDQPTRTNEFEDVRLTTVERDGRWYLSAFHTVAEQARGDEEIPTTGLEAEGADDPELAVDGMIRAIADLDVTRMIELLDPTEAEALQRYAPLFVDQAESSVEEVPLEVMLVDATYSTDGDGDRRSVGIESIELAAIDEQSGETISVVYAEGCLTVTGITDEATEVCGSGLDSVDELLGDSGFADPETARPLLEAISDAFADFESSGIAVHKVGDLWYVSPLRSAFDGYDSILNALDREEIDRIIDAVGEFVGNLHGPTECYVFGEDEAGEPLPDDGCADAILEATEPSDG